MRTIQSFVSKYRGRFAPSPTGSLHFGSLVAAVASYLDAKSNYGEWLVRIEDLDSQRQIPGAADQILYTLEQFGMEWDGEVIFQSRRLELYQAALDILTKKNLIYPCKCSRKEIADSSIVGLNGPIYPGTCRNKSIKANINHALRIRTDNNLIAFCDKLRGNYTQRLQRDVGDFVVRRADGMYAYQLAVVVDDADQGITHVVRGMDLLDSTPRQIYLQQLLGYITPEYMHLPVVTNQQGEKLSKQTGAKPIKLSNALKQLLCALEFLGQESPPDMIEADLSYFWQWACKHWRADKIFS
ncbi:MAG: tRNA glutamyl-Q(34) synthetase GluQRS [Nitrosomonas sp. PRO4]|nr:tRNA glutamyl-Q(34) synthetase GluQRS [Nitrosomonas sp. PRO4]